MLNINCKRVTFAARFKVGSVNNEFDLNMSKISSKNIKRLSAPQSPVVLAILDGWGYRKEKSDNAIKSASTPIMDSLWHAYPHTLISASGSDVGLPDGQMGNSEVGHLTIGSGRIIQQELVRISNIVKNTLIKKLLKKFSKRCFVIKGHEKIKNNFNDAAYRYLEHSSIQKFFAKKIVQFIKELNPKKKGEWIDLGSGPGILADEIEKYFSSQKVARIDFSKKMLLENKLSSKKILWDLNNDLPPEINNCSLLTSNFCIHWLNKPEKIIKNWFSKLKSGGFLIISYPTKNCFPEWKDTCRKIDIEYSGLNFLCSKELLKDFKSTEIHYSEQFNYLENFKDVYKLFRSIKNVGAQSTNCKRKTVKELREIQKFWPKNYNNTVNLSWQIEIQIIKKL